MAKKAMRCLRALMDRGTRRLPGARIADTRKTADMAPLAREAKESAGRMPEAAIGGGGAGLDKAVSAAHAEEGASGKGGRAGGRAGAQQAYAAPRETPPTSGGRGPAGRGRAGNAAPAALGKAAALGIKRRPAEAHDGGV